MLVLTTARNEWKNTPVLANRAISAEQWAQLDDTIPGNLLNRFIRQNGIVDNAMAAQVPVTASVEACAKRLGMTVSHFHQVFDLGVARGVFAAGARSYYQRPANATSIPELKSYDAITTAAGHVVAGEAARAQAEGHPATYDSGVRFDSITGYVAMALPSAAEVGTLLGQFTTLRAESNDVLVDTDTQREILQPIYTDALALAEDIYDTVEYFYRKDPSDSSRRQKCERWGVVYVAEAVPATPPPTPPPTTTPTTTPAPTPTPPA